ncbi:MAG: hypothetical protein KJ724_15970, partial [Proteobacteria bacterium]|nr:hypothetical protein [Pseudomonadota bacterium]
GAVNICGRRLCKDEGDGENGRYDQESFHCVRGYGFRASQRIANRYNYFVDKASAEEGKGPAFMESRAIVVAG